ncbi:hypothetical protein F5884DRAFT_821508 [Xylogone sp. PMI_703]|nr:hypothetical protein F5884DRAFT_821508 [Xylogone sp. PMI_703]
MNEDNNITGGYIPTSIPSPAPSPSRSHNLPHPRSHALRPGSAKEDAARRYVEGRLLHISRRYTKKFQPSEENESVHGYESMNEVCNDLGEVVDVLWLSGTPSLQIPYLLNIALAVTTYMSGFPPAPIQTFSLLRKLDHAFASLLKGQDIVTGEALPGFENGKRVMSKTDMVRCKSLVEATRVQIVNIMSKDPGYQSSMAQSDVEDESGAETGTETGMETDSRSYEMQDDLDDDDDEKHNMDVAKVYEATIVQLGELLGPSAYDATAG